MSLIVTLNGVNYIIPQPTETGWGTNLDNFFVAIAAGCLQKTGGSFTLSADTDFGASFGLKSLYYLSRSSNISATGILRLNNNSDAVSWRNAANNADLALLVNGSNQLQFNGNIIPTGSTALTAKSFTYGDASGLLASTANPTNGQLLIGSTGAIPVVATLTGTTNQVNVANAAGSITLSTPQSIATSSSPTFAALTLTAALTVANGGTGDQSFTAYSVICGGTTSTGALQSVASLGGSGQVLTSNGAGALPTWQNASGTGTVNTGTQYQIGYYATSTNAISGNSQITTDASNNLKVATSVLINGATAADPLSVLAAVSSVFRGCASFYDSTAFAAGVGGEITLGGQYQASTYSEFASIQAQKSNSTSGNLDTKLIIRNRSNSGGMTTALIFDSNQQAQFVDGTAAVPAISFASQTGMGLSKLGTNILGFSTSGAEAMRIDNIGQVGINQTPGYKLDVGGDINTINHYRMSGNQLFPILQIIQNTTTTGFTTTSNTFQNTNLSATITPKFSTSKILIQLSSIINTNGDGMFVTIARGSTNLAGANGFTELGSGSLSPVSLCYYDSPATTSATTYNAQIRDSTGGNVVGFGGGSITQVMILTEIAQ